LKTQGRKGLRENRVKGKKRPKGKQDEREEKA